MNKIFYFFILTFILSPIVVEAAIRFNVIQQCGPINYCFDDPDIDELVRLCESAANICNNNEGITSSCYLVDSCENTVPNPGTVGPPILDTCPEEEGYGPCTVQPDSDPDCEEDSTAEGCVNQIPDPVYTPPESYTITERVQNPIQSVTVIELISKLFTALIYIAIPLAILALVFTGFQFVAAQGKEEVLTKAKKNALYVVVGLAIVLGARFIVSIIEATLSVLN